MFLKCLWFLMERLQVFTEEFLFCSGFIPRWPQHPDGPPGVEAEAASCIDLDAYLPTAEDVQALALGGRGRCRDGRAPPLPRWVVVPPERPPNPRLCDFRTPTPPHLRALRYPTMPPPETLEQIITETGPDLVLHADMEVSPGLANYLTNEQPWMSVGA